MGFRLALLIVLLCACARDATHELALGAHLPDVHTMSLDRRPASLVSLTQGRASLVALWATWCKSCAKELDDLDRLQVEVGERALVVGVAVGEPHQRVTEYLRPRHLAYAQLVDEEFALADALGTKRVPTTLVFGRDGTLRVSVGSLDPVALAALRTAMAE